MSALWPPAANALLTRSRRRRHQRSLGTQRSRSAPGSTTTMLSVLDRHEGLSITPTTVVTTVAMPSERSWPPLPPAQAPLVWRGILAVEIDPECVRDGEDPPDLIRPQPLAPVVDNRVPFLRPPDARGGSAPRLESFGHRGRHRHVPRREDRFESGRATGDQSLEREDVPGVRLRVRQRDNEIHCPLRSAAFLVGLERRDDVGEPWKVCEQDFVGSRFVGWEAELD